MLDFDVPWWAVLYLLIVLGVSVGAAWDDYKSDKISAFAGIISFLFIGFFVFAFFNSTYAAFLGWSVIPMVFVGIAWEFYDAVKETNDFEEEFQDDPEIGDVEGKIILKMASFVVALVVVPGYLAGLKLCWDLMV